MAGTPKIAIRTHGSAAVGDVTAGRQRRYQRHRGDLDRRHDQRAQPDREPGGLDALADRRLTIARAEEACRARRGAVGQERHLRAQRAQDQPADRQAGQADRAEPTDDGKVEQQVDGFGGQHPERGQCQPGDAPTGRGRNRKIGR